MPARDERSDHVAADDSVRRRAEDVHEIVNGDVAVAVGHIRLVWNRRQLDQRHTAVRDLINDMYCDDANGL